jgi:MSHA pilin protein MshA
LVNKHSNGFTLIELIIVIVILGILAATASPKFLDFTKDARISALDGIQTSMKSSLNMVKTYAQIKNIGSGLNQDLTLPDGSVVRLDYGNPEHDWDTAWKNMLQGDFLLKTSGGVCDGSSLCVDSDFNIGADVTVAGSSSALVIWPSGVDTSDNCYVYYAYSAASKSNVPVIGSITDGC